MLYFIENFNLWIKDIAMHVPNLVLSTVLYSDLEFLISIECLTPFPFAFQGYDLSIKTSHTHSDIHSDSVTLFIINVSD